MEIVQLNANAKLSEHFSLGEFTKSGSHPEVYNVPSHEAITNLKRLCTWLEELRKRYNDKYVVVKGDVSTTLDMTGGGGALDMTSPSLSSRPSVARGEISQMRPGAQAASRKDSSTSLGMTEGGGALGMTNGSEEPIRLNSGYRSPQLNRAIGGAPNSNHLTGCAVDIRVSGMEQLIRYAAILLDYADESKQDFDELLIEKNRYGAIWLHFAVRPKDNRRKVAFINA